MFHVGLDIHSTRISICVLGETGQVVHRSQVRGIEEMIRTLKGLPDRFEVCYEASCGYGHYHDLLRPLAARLPSGEKDGCSLMMPPASTTFCWPVVTSSVRMSTRKPVSSGSVE